MNPINFKKKLIKIVNISFNTSMMIFITLMAMEIIPLDFLIYLGIIMIKLISTEYALINQNVQKLKEMYRKVEENQTNFTSITSIIDKLNAILSFGGILVISFGLSVFHLEFIILYLSFIAIITYMLFKKRKNLGNKSAVAIIM